MIYLNKIINGLSTVIMYLTCFLLGVRLKKGVKFKKFSSLYKVNGAVIEIGENTIINSNNFGYHINMHSRCKLIADRAKAKIIIGDNCRIHGTCIHAYDSIKIGNRVLIAANTQIIDANAHELSFDNVENRINTSDSGKPIVIEDNVWIGANCFILGGVTIGNGSVIAANTVVYQSIPPMSLVAGNPAKVIKSFK